MAVAAAAAVVVGAAVSVIGHIRQAKTDEAVAEYNAQIATQNQSLVLQQGNEEAARSLINTRKIIGNEAAAYGASGVGQDGSAQWVMRNTAAQGALNAITIQRNAQIKATGFGNEANLDNYRASNESTTGYIGAASSALSAAGTLARSSGGGNSGTENQLNSSE